VTRTEFNIIVYSISLLYTVSQKGSPTLTIVTWRGLQDSNNFWYEYFWHNWPSSDCSSSHMTKRLFLHYLGKSEQAKYYVFIQSYMIIQ